MARSHAVYIAFNHADELLGAWTVKHELVKVAKHVKSGHPDYRVTKVLRTRDGTSAGMGNHFVTDITEEILKEIG